MVKKDKQNIVVFFGGKSVEREVSVITGLQALDGLNDFNFRVFPIYIDENGDWFYGEVLKKIEFFVNINKRLLKKVVFIPNNKILFQLIGKKLKKIAHIDYIINCCHGGSGENGELDGIINATGICNCSPDVLASSVSMDKFVSKTLFKGAGFDVVEGFEVSFKDYETNIDKILDDVKKFKYPVVVKPCGLGSSIGVGFCENEIQLLKKLEVAFQFDYHVLIERGLTNFQEFFCSCYGNFNECFTSKIEMVERQIILDFEEKYLKDTQRQFPAKIPLKLKNKIQKICEAIFKILKCRGIIRIDFLYDLNNKILYVNEVNTIPGSLSFQFWKNKFDFSELIEQIIELGESQFKIQNNFKTDFHTTILENYKNNACDKLK